MTLFFDKFSELGKENIVMKNKTYSLDSFTDKFRKSDINDTERNFQKWLSGKEEYEQLLHRVFGKEGIRKAKNEILEK